MLLVALAATLALAGEITGPFAAGEVVQVTEKSWLLPDQHYSRCLVKTRDAEDLQLRLDRCTGLGLEELDRCGRALTLCDTAMSAALGQFDIDGDAVNELTQSVLNLERALAAADSNKARLRAQRNLAWGITGGVVLALGTTAAVAIGAP